MTSDLHRVFDFSFALSRHDRGRPLLIHQRRDTLAAMQLVSELVARGYRYGGPVFNQPMAVPSKGPPEKLHQIGLAFVRAGDVIVITTRPPAHDACDGSMKQVERAFTTLEQHAIDLVVPNFLEHCSREQIVFGLRQFDHLRAGFAHCWGFHFAQRGDVAPIKEMHGDGKRWKPTQEEAGSTLVFHIYMPELFAGGPACLMAFGMTGPMTLAWCHRLANDQRELLMRPGFHVLRLQPGPTPERPENLQYTLDWPIEPVLMHDFGPGEHVRWMLRRA